MLCPQKTQISLLILSLLQKSLLLFQSFLRYVLQYALGSHVLYFDYILHQELQIIHHFLKAAG